MPSSEVTVPVSADLLAVLGTMTGHGGYVRFAVSAVKRARLKEASQKNSSESVRGASNKFKLWVEWESLFNPPWWRGALGLEIRFEPGTLRAL